MRRLAGVLVLTMALLGARLPVAMAGEHGGETAKGQEHGGEAVEGSQGAMSEKVATLKEAATALKETHPDLAKKLEKIAEEMGK